MQYAKPDDKVASVKKVLKSLVVTEIRCSLATEFRHSAEDIRGVQVSPVR
jgi:hypothetical protein